MTVKSIYRNGNFEKSGFDLWTTPLELISEIEKEFGKCFDPCPSNWDGKKNGLKIDWGRVNFVNPPYSNLKDWCKKSYQEWRKGKTVILLIPPRTCTRYFHDYIYGYAELRFIKGRLKFGNPSKPNEKPKSAPFPSMLAIFKGGKICEV